jgi:hypothetical protein
VQVGIRRACPHKVGSGRFVRSRKSRGFGIKGPHDHPMGTNLNGRTCRVMRIGVTSLRSASQHVNDARGSVGRFRLMLQEIVGPLHRRLVCTHCRPSDLFGIPRHAGKAVRPLPKNFYDPAPTIDFRYLSLPGYVRGCGRQGLSYFVCVDSSEPTADACEEGCATAAEHVPITMAPNVAASIT